MSAQSYLNIDNILKAAKQTKADAIHPGYGYQAESEKFVSTKPRTGLTVKCELDTNKYHKGIRASDEELRQVNIVCDEFHGEWN